MTNKRIISAILALVMVFVAGCAPMERAGKEETEPIEPASEEEPQEQVKEKKTEKKKTEKKKQETLSVGDTANLREGRVRVYQYYPQVQPTSEFMRAKAGSEYSAIEVEGCADEDSQTFSMNPFFFSLQMQDNTRLNGTMSVAEPALHHADLVPGECVRGWVSFEVPQGRTPSAVLFTTGGESAKWAIS